MKNPYWNIWTVILYVRRVALHLCQHRSGLCWKVMLSLGHYNSRKLQTCQRESQWQQQRWSLCWKTSPTRKILQAWGWFCLGEKKKKERRKGKSSGSAGGHHGQEIIVLKSKGRDLGLTLRKLSKVVKAQIAWGGSSSVEDTSRLCSICTQWQM